MKFLRFSTASLFAFTALVSISAAPAYAFPRASATPTPPPAPGWVGNTTVESYLEKQTITDSNKCDGGGDTCTMIVKTTEEVTQNVNPKEARPDRLYTRTFTTEYNSRYRSTCEDKTTQTGTRSSHEYSACDGRVERDANVSKRISIPAEDRTNGMIHYRKNQPNYVEDHKETYRSKSFLFVPGGYDDRGTVEVKLVYTVTVKKPTKFFYEADEEPEVTSSRLWNRNLARVRVAGKNLNYLGRVTLRVPYNSTTDITPYAPRPRSSSYTWTVRIER